MLNVKWWYIHDGVWYIHVWTVAFENEIHLKWWSPWFVTEIDMFQYSNWYIKTFSPETTPEISLTVILLEKYVWSRILTSLTSLVWFKTEIFDFTSSYPMGINLPMRTQGGGVAYLWSFWSLDCLFGLPGALDFLFWHSF